MTIPTQEVPGMTYRWSPEVERQFLALVEVGCTPAIIAEQIGCSERMARRLLLRWNSGLPLNNERPRATVQNLPPAPARKKTGRPTTAWATKIMNAPPEVREAKRQTVLFRLGIGESVERVSGGTHVPVSVIREWLAAEQGEGRMADVVPDTVTLPWPQVDASKWPADARFEDDSRACRPEPPWRPVATLSDRASYMSNATAWCSV